MGSCSKFKRGKFNNGFMTMFEIVSKKENSGSLKKKCKGVLRTCLLGFSQHKTVPFVTQEHRAPISDVQCRDCRNVGCIGSFVESEFSDMTRRTLIRASPTTNHPNPRYPTSRPQPFFREYGFNFKTSKIWKMKKRCWYRLRLRTRSHL